MFVTKEHKHVTIQFCVSVAKGRRHYNVIGQAEKPPAFSKVIANEFSMDWEKVTRQHGWEKIEQNVSSLSESFKAFFGVFSLRKERNQYIYMEIEKIFSKISTGIEHEML